MRHTITVTFSDGSGWTLTRSDAGAFWEIQSIWANGGTDRPGIIAADTKRALIERALNRRDGATITSTWED